MDKRVLFVVGYVKMNRFCFCCCLDKWIRIAASLAIQRIQWDLGLDNRWTCAKTQINWR